MRSMHNGAPQLREPTFPIEDSIRAVLADDHQRLERVFQSIVTEAASPGQVDLRPEWQAFERELFKHLDAEEIHILPAFGQQRPADARALLDEHARIRARVTELGIDLDLHCLGASRVREFVDTLRAHAQREEQLLYPWAAQRLGQAARDRLRRSLSNRDVDLRNQSEWKIDPERSTLRFSLRHIVIHEIHGHFSRWGGAIVFDALDPARSAVNVWVELASIDTDDLGRDDHIRSPEFFDVQRFPQAKFTSAEVRIADDVNPRIAGTLDLHGIKAEIELQITAREKYRDDQGLERFHYSVRGRLDRRVFGLRWNQDLDVGGIVIGDQVEIVANVEAVCVERGSHDAKTP